VVGSPLFMAPEQCCGGHITPATAVYAFGVTLFYLIAGLAPFDGDTAKEILEKHLHKTPPKLSSFRQGVPQVWEEFIVKQCLAKSARKRPQSMNEVLEKLASLKKSLISPSLRKVRRPSLKNTRVISYLQQEMLK